VNVLACPYCGKPAIPLYKKLWSRFPWQCRHCEGFISPSFQTPGVTLLVWAILFASTNFLVGHFFFQGNGLPWWAELISFYVFLSLLFLSRPLTKTTTQKVE
jgi:hypothetical protein